MSAFFSIRIVCMLCLGALATACDSASAAPTGPPFRSFLDDGGRDLGSLLAAPEAKHTSATVASRTQQAQSPGDDPSLPGRDTESLEADLVSVLERLPFTKGTWMAHTYASASFLSDDGFTYFGHLGLGYCFTDNHTVNIEFAAGAVDGRGGADDGSAAALELLFRSQLLRRDRWTLFIDGGAGIISTQRDFPAHGSEWSFTPQAGLGVMWRLEGSTYLIGGARWYHISNADRHGEDRNPAYNSLMAYIGFLYTF